MNRREFSTQLVAAGVGLSAAVIAAPAAAQFVPVEGTHYVRLSEPLPVPAGKIEVIEFFWYGCPHCNAFEPTLDAWQKKLPADVLFRRVPVAFRDEPYGTHQRIYYALETMGLIPTMHRKVFYAIHGERQRLDKAPEIAAFMAKNGVDSAKFLEVFNSFSVQTKARQARQLSAAYKIDGVPALGVQGRYFTSGSMAGTNEAALSVVDFLVQKVRKSG
ncbi:MAG: thiol:disulfide interchange protein DsbA/DsbL [Betaproteobacteria bacterium]|nr:MAG: thiol:disulfide interchange protein DsbA/DsbL [Betaproteobacteria bacterium]